MTPRTPLANTGCVMEQVILAVVIAVIALAAVSGLVIGSRKKKRLPPAPPSSPSVTAPPAEPQVGEEAETTLEEPRRTIEEVDLSVTEAPPAPAVPAQP